MPPLRLERLEMLGELDAQQIVIGAHVGPAQRLILRQEVRIDGHDRDRRLALPEQVGDGWGVRGRNRHRGDALGQEILDDLHLSGFIRSRRRPGVVALIAVLELGLSLFAALADQIEERIIEALHHDGESLVLGPAGPGQQRQRARERREIHHLAHGIPPRCCPTQVAATNLERPVVV